MSDNLPLQGELLPQDVPPPPPPPPNWAMLAHEAGRVFTPSAPVDEWELFAGRNAEIHRVLDVVSQSGQHAIIFGERGVGKTSLANVLHEFLAQFRSEQIIAPRINCDGEDSFDSVWRKAFDQIELVQTTPTPGFESQATDTAYNPADLIHSKNITPDSVRRILTIMARDLLTILIFDEFDRLQEGPRRAFADMIKSLSDHAVYSTIVLVGVGDTVDQLIEDHQSVARSLVQIQMTRMSQAEIASILDTGLARLEMSATHNAKQQVVLLAKGLPHYAHLIALHATRAALGAKSLVMNEQHVEAAIEQALQNAQQSIRSAYHRATTSPRKDNLFADVLLACALADVDELGTFAALDVRDPMQRITKKDYGISSFAQHLRDFSDRKRGQVLIKSGEKRRFRYRFTDPLLQPFVIMMGVTSRRLPADYLAA